MKQRKQKPDSDIKLGDTKFTEKARNYRERNTSRKGGWEGEDLDLFRPADFPGLAAETISSINLESKK